MRRSDDDKEEVNAGVENRDVSNDVAVAYSCGNH